MNKVIITLTNGRTDFDLTFELLNISLAQKWLKHLDFFVRSGQPWDDPKRFYNFPDNEYSEPIVASRLQELVDIINTYAPNLIDRTITSPVSQDDLNYLHHIFEVYHGLYDQQNNNEFFKQAPKQVQDALGDLNIWIHRYETLGGVPRFVATWKYKPYRDLFTDDEFQYFDLEKQWGDLSLNYCEIGKSLYDLWHDNDQYIFPEAFQPHHHYCFDFNVGFTDEPQLYYNDLKQKIWNYFDNHTEFFNKLGYKKYDPKLSLGSITIAKIVTNESKSTVIENISKHQCFKSIRVC